MSRTAGSKGGARTQQAHMRNGVLRRDIVETLRRYGEMPLLDVADRSGHAEATVRRVLLWLVQDGVVRNRAGSWNKGFYSLRVAE